MNKAAITKHDIYNKLIGFTEQDHSSDGMEAIKKMFTPEFRNRLDSVVQFQPLGEDVILTVVDKFLTELQGQLFWKLFLGIITAILSLARLMNYLLHYHPVPTWSLFFGLIVASIRAPPFAS